MVSKNDTGVAHYNFTAHQPILVIIGEMLLRDHAIESLFVTAPLLSNITRAVATFEAAEAAASVVFTTLASVKTKKKQ